MKVHKEYRKNWKPVIFFLKKMKSYCLRSFAIDSIFFFGKVMLYMATRFPSCLRPQLTIMQLNYCTLVMKIMGHQTLKMMRIRYNGKMKPIRWKNKLLN